MLNQTTYGREASVPLIIAHGLFGSARNWGVLAKRLADDRRVIAVDMRNHAASPWHSSHSYPDQAADLADVIAAAGGQADMLGHSMGGKAAMVLALQHPGLVRRLIVADVAPVAYNHTQSHLIAAMRNLDLTGITRRGQADQALAAIVPDDSTRAFLLQSLDLKGESPRWMLNLDVLDAAMPDILSFPDQGNARFDGPALFLSGGLSDYVQDANKPAIRALFPAARFQAIDGAAHWLHAEKPREFEAATRDFLNA
ncbi:MAG: alpha/beta fold hydrolase [Rhodobacteraceae bacterium]|nr:alpha/beta fold hydrolase [Paracoccaceae bacterium]